MHSRFAIAMIAGLAANMACAEDLGFKEYTTTDCSDSDPISHSAYALTDDGSADVNCIGLEDTTVAVTGYWSVNDGGYLYAYNTTDCSNNLLDSIPLKTCWTVDNFMGWGETVKGISFVARVA
ncbi:hypothetical protein M406DRAFT_69618 [Cryphonectria parasitica EP155]|uniref:Uncharacterized protein n=1 Tax=Cryphonectria parasitica (strain ATCC 38755 / EP155) TaxID=660469 RepID=A0A9P4Y6R1_CRYP1|nr:uncharacterized protein M406DRAFT_69618 [Cryphonectria parasitica EP155]KAF3767474.1 hypothetical protein M406DRAFT_69618 [Cryphonectria parasitica EP155]